MQQFESAELKKIRKECNSTKNSAEECDCAAKFGKECDCAKEEFGESN